MNWGRHPEELEASRGRKRSPNPSNVNNVRNVNTSGALNNNNARNTNGAVADRGNSEIE